MLDRETTIAVVGASGVVGREALSILAESGHPVESIRAFGSDRSAGADIKYGDEAIVIQHIDRDAFCGVDIALFCANADVAQEFAPVAVRAGAVVIDNSSAFRMRPDVPLIVPEINAHLLDGCPSPRIIANPNCSTIILLTALEPIRRAVGIERVIVSTYQAVSGAGAAGLDELWMQTRALASGGAIESIAFPVQCAMNIFTHESAIDDESGFNGEEQKIIAESRKILGDESISIIPTCVRVPVERAHSQAITIETRGRIRRGEIESLIRDAPFIEFSEREGNHPTPLAAAGTDLVRVGRVRADPVDPEKRFSLWVCGDQLRKGAALNAIQIACLHTKVSRTEANCHRAPGV